MKIRINNTDVDITPELLAQTTVSFSFWKGRRFSLTVDGVALDFSLKELQKAINATTDKAPLDSFSNRLMLMRHQGYTELSRYCCIVCLVAKILHYFSKQEYEHLMYLHLLHMADARVSPPEVLTYWNKTFDTLADSPKLLHPHRIELYRETIKAADLGYYVGKDKVELDKATTEKMIAGQTRYEAIAPSKLENPHYLATYEVLDEDTFDLAKKYRDEGLKPVALNLANSHQPGGGVELGSGAQEESLFRRSNYHRALCNYKLYPIDGVEAIYTPKVQVFRTREEIPVRGKQHRNYEYIRPYPVDMIACAAVDLRKDKPIDYEKIMRGKIRLILAIAVEKGHDSLILGAFGCGVFVNDPTLVAGYFKDALESDEFKGRFKKVGFGIILNDTLLKIFKEQLTVS